MKLIILAKKLDFSTEYEYFDYCIDSYINGNFSQCKNLFKAMTKKDKNNLLIYISNDIEHKDKTEIFMFYVNLL